jgi:predicted amino acid racemase
MPVVSVGGTCCLKVFEEGDAPSGVNQIRLCEAVVTGMDTAFTREVPYLRRDVLTMTAEIVECREKPSVPDGEIGMQAFGEKPVFTDRGKRRRALLGIGRQDVNVGRITPLMPGVHIVTASSDHLIVDVTEAEANRGTRFKPGDTLDFRPLYPAMLALSTSRYVTVSCE